MPDWHPWEDYRKSYSARADMGGGVILVPAMIYLLRVPTRLAVGTSLLQILCIAFGATVSHAAFNRDVDVVLALSPRRGIALQHELAGKVRACPLTGAVRTVAGTDCAFLDGGERIVAAAVLCDAKTLEVIGASHVARPCRFPYVPGLLSFREAPALLAGSWSTLTGTTRSCSACTTSAMSCSALIWSASRRGPTA